jgi:hypothetical protein
MNLRYGDRLFRDEEGDQLPDLEAARIYAVECARELIGQVRLDTIRNWFDCVFEVTDEAGRVVLTLPFGEGFGDERDVSTC